MQSLVPFLIFSVTVFAQDDAVPATLHRIGTLRDEGDLEQARFELEELLAAGIEPLIEGLEADTAAARLKELDRLCVSLDLAGLLVPVREATLDVEASRRPADDPVCTTVKFELAGALLEVGEPARALPLFEEVRDSLEQRGLQGGLRTLVIANIAGCHYQLGDARQACDLLEELHEGLSRSLPAGHPDRLLVQSNLAVMLQQVGELDRAEELLREVAEQRGRQRPPDDPQVLRDRMNLGSLAFRRNDLDRALRLFREVHAAYQRQLPPSHPLRLRVQANVAATLSLLGDLEGARAQQEEMLELYTRSPDAPVMDRLATQFNLATTLDQMGELDRALPLLEGVVRAFEERLEPDSLDLLRARENLAAVLSKLGDSEAARAIHEQVLEARRRLLPSGHPDLLVSMHNLSILYRECGEPEKARELIEEVVEVRQQRLPREHPDRIRALGNLAHTYRDLGDLDRAMEILADNERILAREFPDSHPRVTAARTDLASTCLMLGHEEESLALLEQVYASTRMLPATHPERRRAEENLALMYSDRGEHEAALRLHQQRLRALPELLQGAALLAPRSCQAVVRTVLDQYAETRFLGLDSPVTRPLDFEVLETARHVASAPLYPALQSLSGDEVDAARLRLAEAEQALDRLVSAGPTQEPGGEDEGARRWRASIEAAALQRDRAQQELLALVGRPSRSITADAVAAALPPGHAALGLSLLHGRRLADLEHRGEPGTSHYVAYLVTAAGDLHVVELAGAAEIERRIREWRAALGAPVERGVGVSTDGPDEVTAGRALRAALLDPVLARLDDPDALNALHLCVDDALFLVPFDALPLAEGAAAGADLEQDVGRVGDRFRIHHELSFGRLLEPTPPTADSTTVLAVGDVDFEQCAEEGPSDSRPLPAIALSPGSRASAWGQWAPLHATAAEVLELSAQTRRYLDVEPRTLTGADVTEQSLREAVVGQRFVHIATHGWFAPPQVRSVLDRPDAAELCDRDTLTGFAPLTLCGLVLSGANQADNEVDLSGRLLTGQELASFDLSACDLAVLSACETHVGVSRAGQGVQSLQTALHRAGARCSITSLWNVQDWPTQSLMKHFYDNLWGRGMDRAAALWEAKCSLRRQGQSPRIWAGWVLAGDPGAAR